MSTLRSASYALGTLAFASVFAVCATGGLKSPALAAAPRHLFVSDPQASILAIFSLPDLVLKKTLTGLNQPHGLCSDGNGNVWVMNRGTQLLFKYTHSGTLVVTLSDPSGFPFACSVDPGSGNLAVANIINLSGPGETHVYPHGGGGLPPTNDYLPMKKVLGEAYDTHMNLFIDGQTTSGAFVLAKLPPGAISIIGITITGGTIHLPGMLHWDKQKHDLAVGDRRCNVPTTTCVYHVRVSGTTGTITGKTTFKAYNGHMICDMAQGTIYDSAGVTYLAGGDDESSCGYAATSVNVWSYPAGGLPRNSNHSIPFTKPFGTATSAQ